MFHYPSWIYFYLGQLQQLSNRTLICDDKAVFICMNEQGFISWYTSTKEGWSLSFGFDSFINSPVMKSGPELSSIKAEVNFVNSSLIISTITFLRASKLNGTSITCDEETIVFTISPPGRYGFNYLCGCLLIA